MIQLLRKVGIQQVQQRLGGGNRFRHQRGIGLATRLADQLHKGVAASGVEGGLLPVHPALGIESRLQRVGVERPVRMLGAEVAHDHV